MKVLDDKLKDKATEAEITAAVEALCDYLPATYKAQVPSSTWCYLYFIGSFGIFVVVQSIDAVINATS